MNQTLHWLTERLKERPERTFFVWRGERYPYAWLDENVGRWNARLAAAGVARSSVVSVEGDYSPDAVSAVLALIELDAIIVPFTDDVDAQRATNRATAEVEYVVTFPDGGEPEIARTGVRAEHPLTQSLKDAHDPGLVLFSSGSTGASKAAIHNLRFLLEKFKERRHSFVTIAFLLFDHIGGFNTLLYSLANHGTIVTVEDRSPEAICRAIQEYGVELLPTSPTFLNMLLISNAWRDYDLSSLKRITYGTEVMSQRTLDLAHAAFPNATFQQTYGLSELGIMSTKSQSDDSLFVKIGGAGFETRIVDGLLHVRAKSAMLGYLNHPSPFDADGWFNTQDEVEVQGEYLRFKGRRSEIINVGGLKVYPNEVETELLAIPNVRDVVVTGEPHPLTGNIVVARFNLVEDEDPVRFRRRVREHCSARMPRHHAPVKIDIVEHEQFNRRFKKMRRSAADAAAS